MKGGKKDRCTYECEDFNAAPGYRCTSSKSTTKASLCQGRAETVIVRECAEGVDTGLVHCTSGKFEIPESSLWKGIVDGCVPAPTELAVDRGVASALEIVNLAEEFAGLAAVGAARAALGGGALEVSAVAESVTSIPAGVGQIDANNKLTINPDTAGTLSGNVRATAVFTLGDGTEVSQTIVIPYTVTVSGSGAGGAPIGSNPGVDFARSAKAAEAGVQFAQPTQAMWMAFMAACMSVMLVSVVILGWFAHAIVTARAVAAPAKYVAVEPRFAAHA